MGGPAAAKPHRRRLRWGDLGRALLGLVGATLGLLIASWVLPGFDVHGLEQAVGVALLVAIFGAVLRVFLVEGAVWIGWVGALLVGLFGQALAIWLVLYLVYGKQDDSLWWALARVLDRVSGLDPLRLGRHGGH